MKNSRQISTTLSTVSFVLFCLCVSTGRPVGAEEVTWKRVDSACQSEKPAEVVELQCAGVGRFFVGSPSKLAEVSCPSREAATEEPRIYPSKARPELTDGWFPCDQGECLGRDGGPWVALVDWDDPHGWSVAETIRQAADGEVDVELFDLASLPAGLRAAGGGIGDLHLLAQLCRVAEIAADPGQTPPVALNMSLGRLPERLSMLDCIKPSSSSLECEIRSVLKALHEDQDVVPVAAAGNHGRMLFPASARHVLAAGALDLSWYGFTGGSALPSFETPIAARALVPGYGVFLEDPGAPGNLWAAPPGSSYAGAILTGWIAGSLATAPPTGGRPSLYGAWWPKAVDGQYLLADSQGRLWGEKLAGPTLLMNRALCQDPAACSSVTPAVNPGSLELEGLGPALPQESFVTASVAWYHPLPELDPCVPCQGDQLHGPPPTKASVVGDGLWVAAGASGGLPSDYVLQGVYLQVGASVFAFAESEDPGFLTHFANGQFDQLELRGVAGLLQSGLQPSLILVLEVAGGGPEFWHSVPLQIAP